MKRRITKLVVFLLLSSVVNVAVAWGCVLWSGRTVDREPFEDISDPFAWPREAPADWPVAQKQKMLRSWCLRELLTIAHAPMQAPNPPPGTVLGWGMTVFQAGWPCRTLESKHVQVNVTGGRFALDFKPAVTLPANLNFLKVNEARYRTLPLRPTWPGFAINTIFYAAILCLLTLGPFTARRMIRRKRGLCTKCGYDLRGAEHDACPECGVSVVD